MRKIVVSRLGVPVALEYKCDHESGECAVCGAEIPEGVEALTEHVRNRNGLDYVGLACANSECDVWTRRYYIRCADLVAHDLGLPVAEVIRRASEVAA